MTNHRVASTVGELTALLTQFPPDTPLMFDSHDGPDYGQLTIGRDGTDHWNDEATMEIRNPE